VFGHFSVTPDAMDFRAPQCFFPSIMSREHCDGIPGMQPGIPPANSGNNSVQISERTSEQEEGEGSYEARNNSTLDREGVLLMSSDPGNIQLAERQPRTPTAKQREQLEK
jgi:hypothetical protein